MLHLQRLHPHVLGVLAATLGALLIGTMVRYAALRGKAADVVHSRMGSLKSWWTITVLLTAALLFGRVGLALLFGLVSAQGFREFIRLTHAEQSGRPTLILGFLMLAANTLWLALGWWQLFLVWLPTFGLLLMPIPLVLRGKAQGFVSSSTSLFWGLMLIGYFPAHVLVPYSLAPSTLEPTGAAGLVVFLILLTEWNDIAQALVGRSLGTHYITPGISPKKSLEGLLGGILGTVLLAGTLGFWLTPFARGPAVLTQQTAWVVCTLWSMLGGLMISVAGFCGDITMSAVKRDTGVKDSGTLIPGQGGALDRIDSLTFTAPLFAYYLKWLL